MVVLLYIEASRAFRPHALDCESSELGLNKVEVLQCRMVKIEN